MAMRVGKRLVATAYRVRCRRVEGGSWGVKRREIPPHDRGWKIEDRPWGCQTCGREWAGGFGDRPMSCGRLLRLARG